jgi:hypothetical protein
MAKSDSFFIRAKVTQPAGETSIKTTEIDLGSYVNLGVSKSTVMRIHNIEWQIADASDPMSGPSKSGAITNIGAQVCTQLQTNLVGLDNKSLAASWRYQVARTSTAGNLFISDTPDVGPQDWTNGYLIAVDTLYLQLKSDNTVDAGEYDVSIVMECTLEAATQANSVALALSQQ